jgi:predicted component of type VI protein secretion system
MGYAVHYRDAAGDSRLEDVSSLEAAVELVERLRNEDGASDVRAFREVPLEVRTYYKVVALEEQGATVGHQAPPPGAMPLAPPPARVDVPAAPDEPADEPRRPGLFHR